MAGRLRRFFGYARHDLKIYGLNMRIQFRAAASLRAAFITQILGMMGNNTLSLIAWLFFFEHFGTVNGWTATAFIALQGVNALVFGLMSFASVGLMDIPRHVDAGSFDNFLTKPVSLLPNLASSNIDITTIGDIIFGLGLVAWYIFYANIGIAAILMFLIVLVTACIIFWCFALLIPNLLAFYVFDSEKLGRYFGVLFMDAGLYPTGVLTGGLRVLLMTGLPSLLFAVVPVEVLRGASWQLVGAALAIALFWLALCLWLFHRAVRRYESANLVGAR